MADADPVTGAGGDGELLWEAVGVGDAVAEVVGLGDTVPDGVGVGEAVTLPVGLGDALADVVPDDEPDDDVVELAVPEPDPVTLADGEGEPLRDVVELGDCVADIVGVGEPLAVCDGVGVLDASGADSNTTTAIDSGACPRSGSPMTSSSTDTRTDVAVIPFGPNNTGHAPSPPVRPVCDANAKLDDSSPLANVYVVYGGVWSDTDTTVAGPCCAYQDDPSMESVPDSNTMNPIVSAPDLPLESSPE